MANSNIALINLTNTFDDWRVVTNNLANDRNQLRNTSYVKDEGNFRIANGTLYLGNTNAPLALVVESISNVSVGNTIVTGNLIVTKDATVANLTITGNQIVSGNTLLDSDLLVLRANATTDGSATLRSKRATGAGNAEIKFNHTANVWQITSNATAGYSGLLTTGNVENSYTSTSLINVPTASALKTVYDVAFLALGDVAQAANSVRVSQNSSSTIIKANGINFVNSPTVTVQVTSGESGNANVSFGVVGGTAQGATGAQGTIGTQGLTGTGTQGAVGTQGLTGTGTQGAVGTQGALGVQGVLGTQGTSGSASGITNETSSSSTSYYPLLATATSGSLSTVNVSSTKLYFQPSTGTLSATDFAVLSDIRLKSVEKNIVDATDKILNLSSVEFTWNDRAHSLGFSDDKRLQVGLIAQELEELYPTLVSKGDDGYLRANYDKLVPILVQAIKELNERVKKLEGK